MNKNKLALFMLSTSLTALTYSMVPDQQLWNAVKCGDFQQVEEALSAGARVNVQEFLGFTIPLYEAVEQGHTKIVELLLKTGANANHVAALGKTPLHSAARLGYTDIVKLLLEYGADKTLENCMGTTALDMAKARNNKDIVALLS